MGITQDYISNLSKIKTSLDRVARKIVIDNTDFIIFLLKEKQLHLGMKSSGAVAGRYAPSTPDYIGDNNKPREAKIPGTPYNFDWSGGFVENLFIKTEKEGFEILSRDAVQKILEKNYGKLTALTEKHNKIINEEIILPNLYKYIIESASK